MASVSLHPSIDGGVAPGSGAFAGGTLSCLCTTRTVRLKIKGDVAHNHACRSDLFGGRCDWHRQC